MWLDQFAKKSVLTLTVAGLLFSTSIVQAQTLSQTPLEGSLDVPPNVMLILDDSRSMYAAIWDSAYDVTKTYQNWQFIISARIRGNSNYWPDLIPVDQLGQGYPIRCDSGYVKGILGKGTIDESFKCLKLPDLVHTSRVGDDTFYSIDYLQYIFQKYGNETLNNTKGTDLTGILPRSDRLRTLIKITQNLIEKYKGIRWCVSELSQAGSSNEISATCKEAKTTEEIVAVKAAINGVYPADSDGTPLAETLYEITRYFRGLDSYISPVQYRCQGNYAIVITDGLPTKDVDNKTTIPAESKSSFGLPGPAATLPDWDNLHPPTAEDRVLAGIIPKHSDGFNNPYSDNFDSNKTVQGGGTLFLDDLALFANEIDMFRSGNDMASKPWGDAPNALSTETFTHQNIVTHTVGFALKNLMLADVAEYGKGLNISADNEDQLALAFDKILSTVSGIEGASASSTATTSFLSTGSVIFQIKYNTNDWGGELIAHTLNSDPTSNTFGQINKKPLWTTNKTFIANTLSTPIARNVLSVNSNTGLAVKLVWGNLSIEQQDHLHDGGTDGSDKLDYLLGDSTKEARNSGNYRNRSRLLGDVVHSTPVFVSNADFGYLDKSYRTYLNTDLVKKRTPIVYIGGNDGFLHGFDSKTGTEKLAFMPQSVFPYVADLTSPDYQHHYFVDGTALVVDSQLKDDSDTLNWHSILIATMGAGATGLFALDVTDPSKFGNIGTGTNAADIFLWEINNKTKSANFALNGTARQSSTPPSGRGPERAKNGNKNEQVTQDSLSATPTEAWWEVDLGSPIYIDEIKLWNQIGSNSSRLRNYSVFVSNSSFGNQNLNAILGNEHVTKFPESGNSESAAAGRPTTINVNAQGRYVRVQRHDTSYLEIAEVEVFGSKDKPVFPDMGHIIDRPSIIRVQTSSTTDPVAWYALTGNGVHSKTGKAVVYLIDLTTGEKVDEIVLDSTGDNGITSNTSIDIDGDNYVDRVYLTDIKGNIWRLDWDKDNDKFSSAYVNSSDKPTPFFTATETENGTAQPITTAIDVIRFPGDTEALMLYFGTGKYYDNEDDLQSADDLVRSFYGVLDRSRELGDSTYTTIKKSNLVKQTISSRTGSGSGESRAARILTDNAVDYTDEEKGWYIDLPSKGERVVYEPFVLKDRVLFTTLIPNLNTSGVIDVCIPQVSGWLMQVDAFTGGEPAQTVFDINNDKLYNEEDSVTISSTKSVVSGIQVSSGAPLPPSIIRVEPGDGTEGVLKGILSDSSGQLHEFKNEAAVVRTSWRRLN